MTEKLYYNDPYIAEFEATVISSEQRGDYFEVVLDRTAFFPEEGGQSSDTGYIGDAEVVYAYETENTIYHRVRSYVPCGKVKCKINFSERFDKMQQHTAEHVLCGLIHSSYGYDNVGFHLGDDEVTFDINHVMSPYELDRIETLANEVVFKNIKVEAFFPSESELQNMSYRSKLDTAEGIRIVKIGDVDTCACCAPHVANTGEIGLIKCLSMMNHRGGVRITMCAGRRALSDYREKLGSVKEISAMLSEPQKNVATALSKYMSDTEQLALNFKTFKRIYAETLADTVSSDSNFVKHIEGVGVEELRAFANKAIGSVKGILVALSGRDGDYKYVISSSSIDLKSLSSDINAKLCGKGGGSSRMIQGTMSSSLNDIKKYFLD